MNECRTNLNVWFAIYHRERFNNKLTGGTQEKDQIMTTNVWLRQLVSTSSHRNVLYPFEGPVSAKLDFAPPKNT
ncbi:hypothetical protein KUTeg_018583 [Tegillarca granosa]|uniref:Uncharacterized protein n=1 Tax=Tegillarca granosa TaxID=220873 RepID=A0ABQ9EIJ3_TEGGR|nr:hypothetical protein KUTeg_018583 [Tegillarca granosa]